MKFNVKHGPGTMGSLVQLWNAGPQEVVGCSDFNSLLSCQRLVQQAVAELSWQVDLPVSSWANSGGLNPGT